MALGRVLVVGGDGPVGTALARTLRAHQGVDDVAEIDAAVSSASVASVAVVSAAAKLNGTASSNEVSVDGGGGSGKPDLETALADARPDVVFAVSASAKSVRELIAAAEARKAKRFLLVSALGAGDSESDVPAQVYFTMRESLMEKSLAEAHVRNSKLDWTIARPGPLIDGPPGKPVCTEGRKCYGTITAEDLAQKLVDAAESDNAVRRTLSVVDRTAVLLTAPYVRPLEFWEPLPFKEFAL